MQQTMHVSVQNCRKEFKSDWLLINLIIIQSNILKFIQVKQFAKGFPKKFIDRKRVIDAYHNKVINHLFAPQYILNTIVKINQQLAAHCSIQ
jgi:hypothetical protein